MRMYVYVRVSEYLQTHTHTEIPVLFGRRVTCHKQNIIIPQSHTYNTRTPPTRVWRYALLLSCRQARGLPFEAKEDEARDRYTCACR